jgi:hypothetical protein
MAAQNTIKRDSDFDGEKRTVCALFTIVLRVAIVMLPSGALAVGKRVSTAENLTICSLTVD